MATFNKLATNLSLVLAAFLLLSGCAGIKLVEDRKRMSQIEHKQDMIYHIYIPYIRMGVASPIDLANICQPKDWRSVDVSLGVTGSLARFFSAGFVEPNRYDIECGASLRK